MGRGRKRKYDPTIPAHIDQAKLPAGIYWDRSGKGRWYALTPDPEGGFRKPTVAGPSARLSDLHAIMERRAGKDARGTIGYVMAQFHESTEFAELALGTRKQYEKVKKAVCSFMTKQRCTLDKLQVDRLDTPVVQGVVEVIAKGRDGTPGYPTKANHVLRYLRRTFGWGKRHGHNKTNPADGCKEVTERGRVQMPTHATYAIAARHAQEGGARKAHTAGSCPPYLWPAMEIAYLCRGRGIEVVTMTDAHATTAGLRVERVKGSKDNVVRWTPRLRAAWDAALKIRTETFARPKNRGKPIPIRSEQRRIFVNQSGDPLTKGAFDQAWQDFMNSLIDRGHLTPEQRFTPHGLKHRGITDTPGTQAAKQLASGHKTPEALEKYDHEVPIVDTASAPNIQENFQEEHAASDESPRK